MILRDGEIVQIGRPDEVVGAPADEYVRDFVSEVPRSHVLTLRWVMREPRPDDSSEGPVMSSDTIVRKAAQAALASDHPVRVVDNGELVGIVDDDAILRVVVAEEEAHGSDRHPGPARAAGRRTAARHGTGARSRGGPGRCWSSRPGSWSTRSPRAPTHWPDRSGCGPS